MPGVRQARFRWPRPAAPTLESFGFNGSPPQDLRRPTDRFESVCRSARGAAMADPFTLVSAFDSNTHINTLPDLTLPSQERDATVRAGQHFGRFRVERCLGHGGMGAVYLCHDPVLTRLVAVKAARNRGSDVNSGLRFLREAEVLARLQHPNVVTVYDVSMQGQTPYIVLEYIEGLDLRQLLDTRKRLPLPSALGLMLPLLSAIGYAHRQNVLHLDLKPSNILVSADHLRRPIPKVLDFGVCLLSDVDSALDPTRHEFAGTPAYAAPEAIRRQELTEKTDQFAMGVILYEVLSGANPFAQCQNLPETLNAMEQRRYPRLSTLTPYLPAAVSEAVARALEPDPSARHRSVDDLARALMAGGSVSEPGVSQEFSV